MTPHHAKLMIEEIRALRLAVEDAVDRLVVAFSHVEN